MDTPNNYHALHQNIWTGRTDSLANERLFQVIRCIDLSKQDLPAATNKDYAFLGFCTDEGVRRNLGRAGAAKGPYALRQAMLNLPLYNRHIKPIDLGNILCENNDLEHSQLDLAKIVAHAMQRDYRPIVLGGGHEIAWGHFQGIVQAKPNIKLGIINFDSHFDLRPLPKPNFGTSGTSFTQIAEFCKAHQLAFEYMCIGLQQSANTRSLYERAKKLNVRMIDAQAIQFQAMADNLANIDEFISHVDALYVTICMDVFASAFAPGVSAPHALGLTPWQAMPLLKHVLKSGKVISFDIAELAPSYDPQNQTAALAAQIVYNYIHCNYQ